MSSALRTTSTSVGYFVLTPEIMLDGSGSGLFELSSAAVYANDGTISTAAVYSYVDTGDIDLSASGVFSGNGNGSGRVAVTLKDLGKTEYGALVTRRGSSTRVGPVDLRKVQVLSGAKDTITPGEFVNREFWVSLGTNVRTGTPSDWVSSVGSSVALVGKLL